MTAIEPRAQPGALRGGADSSAGAGVTGAGDVHGAADVCVVIVTYRSEAHIDSCLRSIEEGQPGLRIQVVVIDNSPNDAVAARIAEAWPRVTFIRSGDNVGFAAAANRGAQLSESDVIVFLNPDAVLLPGALASLLSYLDAHPEAGVVGARVWDDEARTRLQLSCRRFPSFWSAVFNRYSLATKLVPKNRWSQSYLLSDWDHSSARPVDWVSGCCMAMRRDTFTLLGGFDEAFWMYAEDVDICYRAKALGWETHYAPEAEAIHRIGGSSTQNATRAIMERHRSMWRYYRKHRRQPHPIDDVIRLAIVVRCALQLGRGPVFRCWYALKGFFSRFSSVFVVQPPDPRPVPE